MNEKLKTLMSEYRNKFGSFPHFPAVGAPSTEKQLEQLAYCLKNNVTLNHFYKPKYDNEKVF
ncbi:MAG: hypothetical protein DDT21_02750 [Syntrophomonadaceae bacterium]|nr:hypothetical protein [Bacillota bacterium]